MKKIILFSAASILLILSLSAFQCSSTELTSAKLYIQQKNYDKAIESLQKEISKNPKSDEGYYLLGTVYLDQNKYKEMNEAFNKSLAISDKFKSDIQKNQNFAWGNAYNRGVGFFNKADKVSKDSAKVYYEKAADLFNSAILIHPDSAAVYRTLAVTYVRAGDIEKAVSTLEDQMKVKKSSEGIELLGQLVLNLGINAKQSKDTVTAMKYFNKAIDILSDGSKTYPENANILNLLAQAYIDANKASVAMETFKALSEKNPENETNVYNYGVLLLESGQYEKAIEQFKKAVDIKPDYQNALYNLAVAYVRWGSELSKEADKGNNINSAKADEAKGKFKQALPYLQRLLEISPKDARVWETIGKVYAVLGMNKESKEAFDNVEKYR